MKTASIKRRFLAGLIDYSFIMITTYLIVINFGTLNTEREYILNGYPAILPLLAWCLFTVAPEQLFGATIGNGIMSTIPLCAINNYKPSVKQSLVRHLADPIDMFMFGLVAVITIKNTTLKQRLGDVWANTIVVKV